MPRWRKPLLGPQLRDDDGSLGGAQVRERDLLLQEGDLVLLVAQRLLSLRAAGSTRRPDGRLVIAVRPSALFASMPRLFSCWMARRTASSSERLATVAPTSSICFWRNAISCFRSSSDCRAESVRFRLLGLPRGLDVAAGLFAREVDAALAQLLLGPQRRERVTPACGRGVDQCDLALEQLDLAPLVLRCRERLATALLGMKAAVSVPQAVDDAGQRLARLALGQRLRGEQGPKRLLDLHGFASGARHERAGRDGLVRPTLRLGLRR